MKAKDLIKELERNPDSEVTVSIDISKGEENDNKVFWKKVIEVINESNQNRFTICMEEEK